MRVTLRLAASLMIPWLAGCTSIWISDHDEHQTKMKLSAIGRIAQAELSQSQKSIRSIDDLDPVDCEKTACLGSLSDAWGNRFRLDMYPQFFEIISAGPDGAFDTEDDLRERFPYLRKPSSP